MWRWFLGIILTLAWGFVAAPLAAAEPVEVLRNEAISTFGEQVVFELEAAADQAIVDVALLYAFGTTSDDVPFFVEAKPDYTPGQTVQASFTRNTLVEFLPVGITLRYKWELELADGTILETPEQTVAYDDTRFPWQERSERGITVRWYEGDAAWGEYMLQSAVDGLDRLEQRVGGSVDDPMVIIIYASTSDMRGALPPNSADWIGGQARPDLGLIIGAIAAGDENNVKRLIPHELSHLVLHQATKNNYGGTPAWFDEGLAVANQDIPDFGFAERVENAAINGELIPLQALASNFPDDPEKALLSYAQSESVVRYIEENYGIEALANLVAQFRSGVTDDLAIQEVLGISIDQLDADWRATLPAAQRTPVIEADPQTAPAERFDAAPVQSAPGGNNQPRQPARVSATNDLPVWIWIVAGLGLVLICGGLVALFRQKPA